ncbi:MAG TPA: proteasome accessory factor PafA2 family protein [Vicinamibacterales bacterium]|jgi:proteasome accessory factor A
MRMVMGGETEYAISARDTQGTIVDQLTLLARFLDHAKRTLGQTSTADRGRFLPNGGLLYLDSGLHMEWATPECTSPFDVVRFLKAGDRIIQDLASSMTCRWPDMSEIFCSRSNVDYLSKTLWAAHESYMHEIAPGALPAELVPFLASRVILGAGGWDYRSPALRFTLSPRAHFITQVTDRDSQHSRPLFHTKDEPLSRTGSHRLHVACSETLCSDVANVLRFGTTALVLALVERGVRPGREVGLISPIAALHRFALDPECRARAVIATRQRLTALEIQRHYLSSVERNLGESDLPDWAERICVLWKATLDDLERGSSRVDATLDWAIKRRLFSRRLGSRGIEWTTLRTWDTALTRLEHVWNAANRDQPFELRLVLENDPTLTPEIRRLTPFVESQGVSWSQLPEFITARDELFELDARYGGLDSRGLFNALDASGTLRHQVPGLDVTNAVTSPPPDTRARIRGDVVQRLSRAGTKYAADWIKICDLDHRRELDLANPFETQEEWREMPAPVLTR